MKSCKLFVLWCKNSQQVFFVWNFTWQPWHFYYQHISSSAFIELHKVWALGLAQARFYFCSKKFNYLRFEMKLMFASWRKKNYMQLDASVSFSCTNNISFFLPEKSTLCIPLIFLTNIPCHCTDGQWTWIKPSLFVF